MRVCLLALSPIADDPRVRRQGDALVAAGHEVIGVGLTGLTRSAPPSWPIRSLQWPSLKQGSKAMLWWRVAMTRRAQPCAQEMRTLDPRHAEWIKDLADLRADLYVANDWTMLPVARALARTHRAEYAYDSHEYAVEEWPRRRWRLLWPPYISRLEALAMREACFVSTVSPGIARLLEQRYPGTQKVLIVRSAPPYAPMTFVPTSEHFTVLYHGLLMPDRGLEQLIDSVHLWRPGPSLVIRGTGHAPYVEAIRARLATAGGRVTLAPPVPMTDLVAAANEADVGVFCMPDWGPQARYVLPNKLFEYVMAGLAICVSPLPEMANVVHEHGLGLVTHSSRPEDIADAINSLDPAGVDAFKRASLAAAKSLCWEVEAKKFVQAAIGSD